MSEEQKAPTLQELNAVTRQVDERLRKEAEKKGTSNGKPVAKKKTPFKAKANV